MSHESDCSFCESLRHTPQAGWGGSTSKCPICKQELWVSQTGVTYRLVPSKGTPASSGKWMLLALSVAFVIGSLVGLGQYAFVAKGTLNVEPVQRVEVVQLAKKPVDVPIEQSAGPWVQTKPGPLTSTARVKPLPPPAVKAPLPKPVVVVAESPDVKQATTSPQAVRHHVSAAILEQELLNVPQIDLDPDYLTRERADIAKKAGEISRQFNENQEAFVRKLMKDRLDLAGLPFLLGKDCTLTNDQSRDLAKYSGFIRDSLSVTERAHTNKRGSAHEMSFGASLNSARFWSQIASNKGWSKPEVLPALGQMFLVENKEFRLGLIEHAQPIKGVKATQMLVNRAIFDLDSDVRAVAVRFLRERPKEEYRESLKKALRYPWPPAVQHAAHAIADLQIKELVPDLLALLEEPDPSAPFAIKGENGKERIVVQELVRINHHRNCMLCHPPLGQALLKSVDIESLPIGSAPPPKEMLSSASSADGYSRKSGDILVRADITYLRQDFSLRQKVENPGKWTEFQRFDFLVRTREVTANRVEKRPSPVSDYQEVIGSALSALTSKHALPTARAWREALATTRIDAGRK